MNFDSFRVRGCQGASSACDPEQTVCDLQRGCFQVAHSKTCPSRISWNSFNSRLILEFCGTNARRNSSWWTSFCCPWQRAIRNHKSQLCLWGFYWMWFFIIFEFIWAKRGKPPGEKICGTNDQNVNVRRFDALCKKADASEVSVGLPSTYWTVTRWRTSVASRPSQNNGGRALSHTT